MKSEGILFILWASAFEIFCNRVPDLNTRLEAMRKLLTGMSETDMLIAQMYIAANAFSVLEGLSLPETERIFFKRYEEEQQKSLRKEIERFENGWYN